MSPYMGPVMNDGREVQVQIVVDVEKFAEALRGLWTAITDAVRPLAATFLEFGQRYARYMASTPEAKARRELDNALDAAEAEYTNQLGWARHELLGGLDWHLVRERYWAALTWGISEQDALDRAMHIFRYRFQLNWTEAEAAQLAEAILEGYSSRPAAWR